MYEDFWDKYGTHIVQSARFGGHIHAAVAVERCSVAKTHMTSETYGACLTAEYKGIEGNACEEVTDSDGSAVSASQFINNKHLTARGGSLSAIGDVITDFQTDNKISKNVVDNWIASLNDSHSFVVVGGHISPIHDGIKKTISWGVHNLNELHNIADGTLYDIADAMETAYEVYTQQLIDTQYECDFSCNSGALDNDECVCINCDEEECCGIDDIDLDGIEPLSNMYTTIVSTAILIFII